MLSVVYISNRAESQMVNDLTLAGFTVFDCLSASEALYLHETEHVDAVVIAAGVDDPELPEVRQRVITLELDENALAADISP